MIREAVEKLNEAKAKFWDIVSDYKNVTILNRTLTKKPELDISFYDGVHINNGWNEKGKIYQYKGHINFATRFNSIKEFEVMYYDAANEYTHSEYLKVSMLYKKLKLKKLPYELMGQAVTTIANVRLDKSGDIIVDFKNGGTYILIDDYFSSTRNNREKMLYIDGKVFKLEKLGFKVNKIRSALKVLVPEIYNKRKINRFTNIESLNEYLEMEMDFGFIDTGGITGEGIGFEKNVGKDSIILTTYNGHSFYGEWTKFNIVLKTPIDKKEVDKRVKNYKAYQDEMHGRMKSYGQGLADYIAATGGHKGNPVWMD